MQGKEVGDERITERGQVKRNFVEKSQIL